MATATPSATTYFEDRAAMKPLGALAMIVSLAACGLAITMKLPSPTPLSALAVIGVIAATAWMLFSRRYEWSLVILMLYVGLADGYLKLSTGSSQVTLVRDLMLYAIAAGFLIRMVVRREMVSWPPLTGWVVAWVLVVAVQITNPHDGTLLHSLASVRPHAEWVPLFFLGYLVIRSKARIRAFLMLLLAIAAINGIVGLVQVNMTPGQLSSWGPGYAQAIKGEGSVSARGFADENGTERNRPFALGGDIGFGGSLGFLAVPAALALLGLRLRPRARIAVIALSVGVAMAILTSEGRVYVIAGVVAVLAFAGLTVTSRAGVRTVVGLAVGLALAYAAVGVLLSGSEEGAFDRYNSIANPGEAISTAYSYRSEVLSLVPTYMTQFPFGAGIGSSGPAGSFGGGSHRGLNGESEPTFLLIEAGIPGLAVMLGFTLTLLYLSVTRIRRIEDRETRVLLTAVAAPLFALFATWLAGISTATTPGAPYLWLAAGVLSYWLLGPGSRSLARPGAMRGGKTVGAINAPSARWSSA
jgi:hypothetical protein